MGLSESETVDRSTKEYGGDLLQNSRTFRSLRGSVRVKECDVLKRRLGNIDMVRSDHRPREPPTPHPHPTPAPPDATSKPLYLQLRQHQLLSTPIPSLSGVM